MTFFNILLGENPRNQVMPVDSFDPPDVWCPFGAFSMAALQGQGQVTYLKGQVSLDSEGGLVGKGDMRAPPKSVRS